MRGFNWALAKPISVARADVCYIYRRI